MSKKLLIAIVLILAVGALVYFKGTMKDTDDGAGAGTITYGCEGGKSFTLTAAGEGKVTVSGAGVTYVTLTETTKGSGYWANADGKTTVKTVGSYVILVQDDQVTHDRCQEAQ